MGFSSKADTDFEPFEGSGSGTKARGSGDESRDAGSGVMVARRFGFGDCESTLVLLAGALSLVELERSTALGSGATSP